MNQNCTHEEIKSRLNSGKTCGPFSSGSFTFLFSYLKMSSVGIFKAMGSTARVRFQAGAWIFRLSAASRLGLGPNYPPTQ
jgi:hypothetical protein